MLKDGGVKYCPVVKWRSCGSLFEFEYSSKLKRLNDKTRLTRPAIGNNLSSLFTSLWVKMIEGMKDVSLRFEVGGK
jgi:hypothetical protein